MWLFALFDLPVETKEQRREYAQFPKSLLSAGFTMLQYSVYAKRMASEEAAEHLRAKVHAALPPQGQVRLLTVTDHQFGKMEVYVGKRRRPVEQAPLQISLF